jgi:hypothetical protein
LKLHFSKKEKRGSKHKRYDKGRSFRGSMIILKLLFMEDKEWRDCLGIEPSGDGTRLPRGFEDLGKHQLNNQPRENETISVITFFSTVFN